MFPNARMLYEQDVQPNREGGSVFITKGVIGWNSGDEHHDLGTEFNDGHTFVRVTLFRGKPLSPEETADNKAHGSEIICKVMGPMFWVPPKGTPVLVAFPDGESEAPGSGVVLGSIGPSPGIQFKKDKPKLDFGPDQDFIIKARTIILSDYQNNHLLIGNQTPGNAYIRLANNQGTILELDHGNATLVCAEDSDAKGVLALSSTSAKLIVKDKGFLTIDNNGTSTLFGKVSGIFGGMVLLGKAGVSSGFTVTYTTVPPTGIVPIPVTTAAVTAGQLLGATNVFITGF